MALPWSDMVTPLPRGDERLSKREGLEATIPAWRWHALVWVVLRFASFLEGPQSQTCHDKTKTQEAEPAEPRGGGGGQSGLGNHGPTKTKRLGAGCPGECKQ